MNGKTILIADDNEHMLQALTKRLENEGFAVIACRDAYQALDRAIKSHPALLVLDVNMPAGDGFSVQDRIKGNTELCRIPVIYVTGDKSGDVRSKAREAGAYAVVHKPFKSMDLLTLVYAALSDCEDKAA